MTILDTFYVLFKSDTKEVDKGLQETEQGAENLLNTLKKTALGADGLNGTLKDLAMRGAGLLGISLSLKVLYDNIKENAEAMAALDRLAARLNTTADAVDQFIDTGALLGLKEEVTKGGLEALNQAAQDTALGMGRAKKVFEELGITVTDTEGKVKPITSLMTELAAQFKDMEKGKQVRIMERLGLDPALLKLFNADLGALNERLENIDKAANFNFERLRTLTGAYTKQSNAFKLELNSVFAFFEKMRSASYTEFLPIITKGLQFLTKITHELYEYIMKHSDVVRGALIAIGAAITYFLIPAAIKGAIAVATMLAPFLLVGAAVAAVVAAFALMYEDLQVYLEGGDSLLGRFLPKWEELKVKIEDVNDLLKKMAAIFSLDVAKPIEEAFRSLLEMIGLDSEEAVQKWLANFNEFRDGVLGVFNDIKKAVQDAIDLINKVFELLGFKGGSAGVASEFKATVDDVMNGIKAGIKGAKETDFVGEALSIGREMLGRVSDSPINSTNSNAINNSATTNKTQSVTIGEINVQTQASDADGISKSVGSAMNTQMRQALNNYDDGVVA